MQFCAQCESIMTKNTPTIGGIIFQCRCGLSFPGNDNDTLMASGYFDDHANQQQKHDVFISQSAHDLAGNKVLKDCPNCGLNFLTMIRYGQRETVIYTCSCGYEASHSEYMQMIHSKK